VGRSEGGGGWGVLSKHVISGFGEATTRRAVVDWLGKFCLGDVLLTGGEGVGEFH